VTETTETIPQLSATDPAAHSGDVVAENIAALKALFPQIVTDGKVDFDVLRQLLGDTAEEGEERYGFNWKGKAKARAHALTPTLATLRPAREDSVDWDTTSNLMIEGDNLEVLKCLRKAYAGKVKLIYIDPPYNTGKDFVYPDNYTDSVSNYLELTGQRGKDGAQLTSNREASGRFHTDWLNMMYPRLVLAREFLRDDGLIAISLNDSEMQRLRLILDEIFGEHNFIAQFVWKARVSEDTRAINGVSSDHEYIICYGNSRNSTLRGVEKDETKFKNDDGDPRGPWRSADLTGLAGPAARPNLHYDLIDPATGINYGTPPKGWRYEPKTMARKISEGRIIFPSDPSGRPRHKLFLSEIESNFKNISSIITNTSTSEGTKEINSLMGSGIFDFPKPTQLLKTLIEQTTESHDIVMDFFAGSGTTGHSTWLQNAADGGKRRYALVQLPEVLDASTKEQSQAADFCDKLGKPRNIAELTKERLRRAGAKVKADNPGALVDTGFRVFKLDTSNLKPWQPDADKLEASLLDAVSNIVHGRSEEDLLVELLLKTGIDLTTPEEVREIAGKTVHALGGGMLIVCLADIADADAEKLGHGIAEWQAELDPPGQTTLYFKDEGFASACAKANLAAILRQRMGDRIAKLASI
jgi:adenine-specific DNA-methyltransferase